MITFILYIYLLLFFFQPVSEGPACDSDGENGKGRVFHRSVSMGTNGAPWNKKETEARVIMTGKLLKIYYII